MNLPGIQLPIPSMTEKDEADLEFALEHGADYVALSFVRTADDVAGLRERIDAAGARARVIAKIEKAEAIAALDEILAESDAVMLGTAFRAQIAVVLALVVAGIALHRSARWRRVVPLGLLIGSLATLGIAVLLIPVIVLGFDGFLLRFHELFFRGDSWRFSDSDTLLRVYPEVFWQDTAKLAAGIAVGQAIVVALVSSWWLRRLRRRAVVKAAA